MVRKLVLSWEYWLIILTILLRCAATCYSNTGDCEIIESDDKGALKTVVLQLKKVEYRGLRVWERRRSKAGTDSRSPRELAPREG